MRYYPKSFRLTLIGFALLSLFFQGGCSLDLVALRNCDKSGEGRFDGYPLASHGEHEKAQRFTPDDPANCLLYVVREKDWWSGTREDRTYLMVTPEEIKPRSLPANPAALKNQVVAIREKLYAMWELPSKTYFLYAFFPYQYSYTFMENQRGDKGGIAEVQLDCRPGGLMYFAVADRGYRHNVVLKRLSEEDGKNYVRSGLRSIGFRELDLNEEDRPPWREDLWYKGCPRENQR